MCYEVAASNSRIQFPRCPFGGHGSLLLDWTSAMLWKRGSQLPWNFHGGEFDLDRSKSCVEPSVVSQVSSSPIKPSKSQIFAYWPLETQLHLPFFILQLVIELHPTVAGSPSIPHSSGKFEHLRVTSITFSLNLAKPPQPNSVPKAAATSSI